MTPAPDSPPPANRPDEQQNRPVSPIPDFTGDNTNLWFSGSGTHGLSSRFGFSRHTASTVVAFAPWLDVLLLCTALVLFQFATALIPGQPVELPAIGFRDGAQSSISVVVTALPNNQPPAEISPSDALRPIPAVAWFQDERYLLNHPHRISALQNKLGETRLRSGEDTLLLYLDKNLSLESTLQISSLARNAGFRNVSCVSKY
ncbi:MAG: hypothetical protein ACI4QT_01765 [Kiritimatiellia bacterium]